MTVPQHLNVLVTLRYTKNLKMNLGYTENFQMGLYIYDYGNLRILLLIPIIERYRCVYNMCVMVESIFLPYNNV